MKYFAIISMFFSAMVSANDFNKSDSDLISHLKRTDYIFSSSLGACSEESLKRETIEGSNEFIYEATCEAKVAKESDCPEYAVVAKGTIDAPSWATIRTWSLKLKCYG